MATFTKDQRNRFYRAIEESKLNSSDCEFSVLASGAIKVKHSVSGSVLSVQFWRSRFPMEFTIGDDPEKSFYERRTLGAAIIAVRKWANGVYDWMAIPELWENPPGPGSIPGELIPYSGNTSFAEEEQEAISILTQTACDWTQFTNRALNSSLDESTLGADSPSFAAPKPAPAPVKAAAAAPVNDTIPAADVAGLETEISGLEATIQMIESYPKAHN